MTEYWDQGSEDFEYGETPQETEASYVLVNGATIRLDAGANLKEAAKTEALKAGLGKFRVLLNGEEIRPSEAPDLLKAGDSMELRPYDNAG